VSLPLGKYTFQIRESSGRKEIFDVCRKIYVVLTPEEFVRQHLLHYLVIDKNYPLGFIQTEYSLLVNDTPKRSDIIVFDAEGKTKILCECKAAKVKIDFSTIEQIMRYNQTLKADYFIVTNGATTIFAKHKNGEWIELEDIPPYQSTK
jgi:Type I restriction enzyme R protein N terminus (HSDR_N)